MRVSGQVQDGNLVMYDEQTGSLWLQKSGEALEGQLKGLDLPTLPESQYDPGIRWDEWLRKHPDTQVLHCDHCIPRVERATH